MTDTVSDAVTDTSTATLSLTLCACFYSRDLARVWRVSRHGIDEYVQLKYLCLRVQ